MRFSVFFLFLSAILATSSFEVCSYKASDGSVYDLHLIRSHHQGLRNIASDAQGMKYYWNLCESIIDGLFSFSFFYLLFLLENEDLIRLFNF